MSRVEVLIIGGGATGTGMARDLAQRGAQVMLLERSDFSAGASGRNHGMLHSGGRYVVNDPASAMECARENLILKRIAGYCIEDSGGLFISGKGDDASFGDRFLSSCRSTGVVAREIEVKEALDMEPGLTNGVQRAVEVNDASVDPFFLVWGNIMAAREDGAQVINHSEVVSMHRDDGRIGEVRFRDSISGSTSSVRPEVVVNASGAWADRVASLAGLRVPMNIDKGSMVVINGRLSNRLINRLRPPSDGDIIVPHRSASLLGTTSTPGDLSNDRVTGEEVSSLLAQAAQVMPGIVSARAVRAYAGVRPLVAENGEGRDASRTFRVIDHAPEGVDNVVSVVGGKLTTYRLMAEKASDVVLDKLGRKSPCRTDRVEILPPSEPFHLPPADLSMALMASKYGPLSKQVGEECLHTPRGRETACSCEVVLHGELEHFARMEEVRCIGDLMRRTRAGMGFCQGGLCAFRLASAMSGHGTEPGVQLEAFLVERWKGVEPVLFGDQLRQEVFKSYLFGVYGIDHTKGVER